METAPVSTTLDRLRSEQRLSGLAVSESGFAFDPQFGQSYTVNQAGVTVLSLLSKGMSIDSVASRLAQEYDIPETIALTGIEAFLRQLGRYLL